MILGIFGVEDVEAAEAASLLFRTTSFFFSEIFTGVTTCCGCRVVIRVVVNFSAMT